MSDEQRAALVRMARSSSLPHRQVVQAKALLLAVDGVATNDVARRCGINDTSVRKWRRRFTAEGLTATGASPQGGAASCGCPRTVAAVVADTLHNKPDEGSTHWTTRLLAKSRHRQGYRRSHLA